MTTLLNGLVGGALAGVLASVLARTVRDGGPTARSTVDELFDTDVATDGVTAMLADLVYGGVAGGALLALELFVLGILAVPPSTGEAIAVGLGWGAVLLSLAALVASAVRGAAVDRATQVHLIAFHLSYGLALGLWIRISWLT